MGLQAAHNLGANLPFARIVFQTTARKRWNPYGKRTFLPKINPGISQN